MTVSNLSREKIERMKKMNEESGKPKKRRKIPLSDTYVLIISLMALAVIMTYIIPAGSFERVMDTEAGQLIVQPGTYQTIEQTPVSPLDFLWQYQGA